MIDSGSQITLLSPNFAKKIGLGFDTLSAINEIPIGGSGKCTARLLPIAEIILRGTDYLTKCRMYVPNPKCYARRGWSLIGQDVLRQFNLKSDNKTGKIMLIPISSLTAPVQFK